MGQKDPGEGKRRKKEVEQEANDYPLIVRNRSSPEVRQVEKLVPLQRAETSKQVYHNALIIRGFQRMKFTFVGLPRK